MSSLIAGAWRNDVAKITEQTITGIEKRKRVGFGLQPYEVVIVELAEKLDAYDALVVELLTEEPAAEPAE